MAPACRSRIFSTDLIETNLLEFTFTRMATMFGCSISGSASKLPSSQAWSTADDVALLDHAAACAKVRDLTGAATIQVVAHCYGATTFTMALLAGLTGVRSVVLSQVSAHLIVGEFGKIKAGLHLPDFLDVLGVKSLTAYRDTHADWEQSLLDDALRLYPIQHGEQMRQRGLPSDHVPALRAAVSARRAQSPRCTTTCMNCSASPIWGCSSTSPAWRASATW